MGVAHHCPFMRSADDCPVGYSLARREQCAADERRAVSLPTLYNLGSIVDLGVIIDATAEAMLLRPVIHFYNYKSHRIK